MIPITAAHRPLDFWVCGDFPLVLELEMEKRVIHEKRLSRPLMAEAIIAAIGLFSIGVKPLIDSTTAFAESEQVQKIAICNLEWTYIREGC